MDATIRVQIVSDLHGEFGPRAIPDPEDVATDADIVVQAGDMAHAPESISRAAALFRRPQVLVNIAGNHEHYRTGLDIDQGVAAMYQQAEAVQQAEHRCVLMLEQDAQVVIVRGVAVRLVGTTLWTDYALFGDPVMGQIEARRSLNDHRMIRAASTEDAAATFPPSEAAARHSSARAFLGEVLGEPFDGPTIVITHHLPSLRSVSARFREDRLTAGFASHADDLIATGAALWVHGHTHDSCQWRDSAGTLVVCNPAGYVRNGIAYAGRENPQFDPRLVISLRRLDGRWRAEP